MDLIVTDAGHIDRAVIEDYALDAAWGADENDFELTVDRMLEPGSYVYADGSELGGVIDSLRDRLDTAVLPSPMAAGPGMASSPTRSSPPTRARTTSSSPAKPPRSSA